MNALGKYLGSPIDYYPNPKDKRRYYKCVVLSIEVYNIYPLFLHWTRLGNRVNTRVRIIGVVSNVTELVRVGDIFSFTLDYKVYHNLFCVR